MATGTPGSAFCMAWMPVMPGMRTATSWARVSARSAMSAAPRLLTLAGVSRAVRPRREPVAEGSSNPRLLPAGVGLAAADAYRELRRAQHRARLDEASTQTEIAELGALAAHRQAGLALWRAVFG